MLQIVHSSVKNRSRADRSGSASGWIADERFSFVATIMIWLLVVIMIVPDDFDYSALLPDAPTHVSTGISGLIWLLLLAAGALIVLWRASLAWLILRSLNPFFTAFLALVLISAIWSMDPPTTVKRFVRILTMVLDCMAFVMLGWNVRRYQRVLLPVITSVLAGSIVFGLVSPRLAIHPETSHELLHSWRGLTAHKNSLGAISAFGLILWVHAGLIGEVRRWSAVGGAAIAMACLLLSRSTTSLVTSTLVISFLVLFLKSPPNLRRYMPLMLSFVIGLLMVFALAILRIVPGLDILLAPITLTGKDLTFTGRSDIWAIIIEHVQLHPFLGTGYGAYWGGPRPGTPSYAFVQRMYFYPGSAHNGYLEIINDLGAVGFVCLIGYLVTFARQAFRVIEFDRASTALFLGLFLQDAVANLTETHFLFSLNVWFVFMNIATFSLARTLLEIQFRRYYGEPTAPSNVMANTQHAGRLGAIA